MLLRALGPAMLLLGTCVSIRGSSAVSTAMALSHKKVLGITFGACARTESLGEMLTTGVHARELSLCPVAHTGLYHPVYQKRKLRPTTVEQLAQGHTARKEQRSQDLDPMACLSALPYRLHWDSAHKISVTSGLMTHGCVSCSAESQVPLSHTPAEWRPLLKKSRWFPSFPGGAVRTLYWRLLCFILF